MCQSNGALWSHEIKSFQPPNPINREWGDTSVITASTRTKHRNLKLKVILRYSVSSKPAWTTGDPVLITRGGEAEVSLGSTRVAGPAMPGFAHLGESVYTEMRLQSRLFVSNPMAQQVTYPCLCFHMNKIEVTGMNYKRP